MIPDTAVQPCIVVRHRHYDICELVTIFAFCYHRHELSLHSDGQHSRCLLRRNGPPNIEGMITLKVDNVPYGSTVDELRRVFEK